jgi:SAM-dependent methyltransferase
VVDVGSGTGILTELLLHHSASVYAVEPNAAMRAAAEAQLDMTPGFQSIDGRSEATTLPDACADLITAGQAFHWFEPVATRVEFERILKPGGWVALIWNERKEDGSEFLRAYQELLEQFGTDFRAVEHKYVADAPALQRFFGPGGYTEQRFANQQVLDWEGLAGRLTSTSYVPAPDDPRYGPMIEHLRQIFDSTQRGGTVVMPYETTLNWGRLS